MMIHEFIARTNYHPSDIEYRMIEESYYDFIGDKDEFCKQWIIDKNNGNWEKELNFRLKIEELKRLNEALSANLKETDRCLGVEIRKNCKLRDQNGELIEKLNRIERVMRNVFDK